MSAADHGISMIFGVPMQILIPRMVTGDKFEQLNEIIKTGAAAITTILLTTGRDLPGSRR